MAIFKSISSISNVKLSMKSSLIANSFGAAGVVSFGNDDTSCFGGFDGGFDGGFGGCAGGGRNINIIDIDLNQCGRRRRRSCC